MAMTQSDALMALPKIQAGSPSDLAKLLEALVRGDFVGLLDSTELGYLNGVTAGTGAASKAVVLDANGQASIPGGLTVTPTTLTAAGAVTAADSGKTFFLNNATGFATALPAPAAGLRFTFISILANTSGNHTITTATSANIIKGQQYVAADAAGDTGTADDTISFVANQSVAGDRVELFSDGTSWFAYAHSAVAAGMTFTQAS